MGTACVGCHPTFNHHGILVDCFHSMRPGSSLSAIHPLFDTKSAEAERQVLRNRSLGPNGRNGAQCGHQNPMVLLGKIRHQALADSQVLVLQPGPILSRKCPRQHDLAPEDQNAAVTSFREYAS